MSSSSSSLSTTSPKFPSICMVSIDFQTQCITSPKAPTPHAYSPHVPSSCVTSSTILVSRSFSSGTLTIAVVLLSSALATLTHAGVALSFAVTSSSISALAPWNSTNTISNHMAMASLNSPMALSHTGMALSNLGMALSHTAPVLWNSTTMAVTHTTMAQSNSAMAPWGFLAILSIWITSPLSSPVLGISDFAPFF